MIPRRRILKIMELISRASPQKIPIPASTSMTRMPQNLKPMMNTSS